MEINTFYKTNKVDKDFDEVRYQKEFPETKDFYQPYCKNNQIDDKHRLYFHYVTHTQAECQKIARLSKSSLAKPPIAIIGNGSSLRGFDLTRISKAGFHSFGMNAAYRHWREIDWWPTYFACYDIVVTNSHKESFKKLIHDPNMPIKNYFFRLEFQSQLQHQKCHFVDGPQFEQRITTGTLACRTAICLGYKKLFLLGIDVNYVEILPEAVVLDEKQTLKMKKTPEHNPNYFFEGYQQEGDIYNLPRGNDVHYAAWNNLAESVKDTDIEIINCNPKSNIKLFPFMPFNEVLL